MSAQDYLDELRKAGWTVIASGHREGWVVTIQDQNSVHTYHGPYLTVLARRAWAGEPGDRS